MADIPVYGDLVVSGSAKVGTDSRSAAIAGVGTIRRDGSNIQYSDGTNWITLEGTTSWVTVSVDLGQIPRRSGSFIITSTGLTAGRQVIIKQATGGVNNDDLEMDNISANGIVISPTEIKVFWNCGSAVVNSKNFNYLVV